MDSGQPILICPLCQRTYAQGAVEFCHKDGARLHAISERGVKWLGRVLGQRYEVLRFVGAGGMAEVYEARRLDDDLRVALKLLRPQISDDAALLERFRLEARLIGLIDHPNVIAVYDCGTFDDRTAYIAMELLQGQALDEVLEAGPLADLGLALDVARQACEGFQAAHDKGIVHRDVKPANLYLQEATAGQTEVRVVLKVLDLGIAKLKGDRASNLTATGMVFGSPDYISPEQALGRAVDPRADIYSLGVVLFHVFTGQVPFFAESFVGMLTNHASTPPLWPRRVAEERGLPAALGDVIMKTLQKNPDHRYQTMLELRDALTEALTKTVGSSRPAVERARVFEPVSPSKRLVSLEQAGDLVEDGVVEIAEGTYWVGRREGVVLERNIFLRVYRGAGHQLNVIIDPGPTKDLSTLARKAKKVIGPLEQIDIIFLNHQDPDAAGNASVIQELNPQAHVICSEDTWRLVHFYGLKMGGYSAVEHFKDLSTTLATGHRVSFVPTPYCHFRGAVMYYDQATRVLFSGDLFGGLSQTPALVLEQGALADVEIFHQLYMPSCEALRHAVARVRRLDPAPLLIAPQHGGLIRGDLIEQVLSRIERLPVGVELMNRDATTGRYLEALNDIVDDLIELVGEEAVAVELRRFSADGSFPNLFVFEGSLVREIKIEPRAALLAFLHHARSLVPDERLDELVARRIEQYGVGPLDVPK